MLSDEDIADFEVLRDVAMAIIFGFLGPLVSITVVTCLPLCFRLMCLNLKTSMRYDVSSAVSVLADAVLLLHNEFSIIFC